MIPLFARIKCRRHDAAEARCKTLKEYKSRFTPLASGETMRVQQPKGTDGR
jgi:hypothetical protein